MTGLSEAFTAIGDAVEHRLPQTHAAGLALAVTDPEDTLGVVVRGFSDVAAQTSVRPDTRFEIGSISKQFAAIVALQEVEAGRLDLHAPIEELLPWLSLAQPFGPITVHHLLTHSSGLPIGTEEAPTGPGALALLQCLEPAYPPGERFSYSNDGYKIVGAVLERLTGSPMHELLRERILGPLGMQDSEASITDASRLRLATGYEPVFDDRPPHLQHPLAPARWTVSGTADGSIVSTVVDMASYARMLLGEGATMVDGHEVRILSDRMFAELIEPRIATDDARFSYGYGLDVHVPSDQRRVAHSGGMVGFTALLDVDLDAGLACITLQNGSGDKSSVTDYALAAVRGALAGEPVAAAPHPPAPTAIQDAEALAGPYTGSRPIALEATDDGLRLVDGPVGVALERWPDTEDAFLVPHPSLDRYLLRVLRDDEGRVVELVHGPDRFAPEGSELPDAPAHDPSWEAFVGVYRSNNPWSPLLRVFLRAGGLWVLTPAEGVDEPLLPMDDGSFCIEGPSRIRFEEVVESHATILVLDTGRWYRSFEA
jgi:CubicO group peptidase (beta-lactamase class C family)